MSSIYPVCYALLCTCRRPWLRFLAPGLVLSLVLASALPSPVVAAPTVSPPAQATTSSFLVTWHASAEGRSDTNDGVFRHTLSQLATMAGSTIVRIAPDGTQTDTPFDVTVNDQQEETESSPCDSGGSHGLRYYRMITDPGAYSGSTAGHMTVVVHQRQDGSWYMVDPFPDFWFPLTYHYTYTDEKTFCYDSPYTYTYPVAGMPAVLLRAGFGDIEGDALGNVFAKDVVHTEPATSHTPPMVLRWHILAQRLTGFDLTVRNLEVTQTLQDEANSIPLVQGRRTVVRAYIGVGKDPQWVAGVTGRLTGYDGATALGTVGPFNPGGRIIAPPWPDWHQIDDTLNFELPIAWTMHPNLRLEVEVNPDHSLSEMDYTNNRSSVTVQPKACGGERIAYLPIHYTPPEGYDPADPSYNILVGQEFMQKIYPLREDGLDYIYWPGFNLTASLAVTSTGADLLTTLDTMLSLTSPQAADHIFAWLPSLALPGANGQGRYSSPAAFGADTENPDLWRRTFAHEIGHNHDLKHAPLTTQGAHWFDVYERSIKPVPASVGGKDLLDFMVPGRLESEAWISPTNYRYLVDDLCGGGADSGATFAPAGAGPGLLLSGTIVSGTAGISGSLDPLVAASTASTRTLPAGSLYCADLESADGSVLAPYCFDATFEDDSGQAGTVMSFSMVVPAPPGLARVELVSEVDDRVLSSRVRSAHPPAVALSYPNAPGLTLAGPQTITWNGSDADGDALSYTLLYSRDGGTSWIGLAGGIRGGSYTLDFGAVPGATPGGGRIKVVATDGFDTAQAASAYGFNVASKPPRAAILSPRSGASSTAGVRVVLEGMGIDPQDGSLSGAALTWRSDRDGALGTGRLLEAQLSPGTHTITLTATDGAGLSASASVSVTVGNGTGSHRIYLPVLRRS